MRFKTILATLMLASILAMTLVAFPVRSQGGPYGPRTDYLHIKNFGSPDAEFQALEATVLGTAAPADEVYVVDWPVSGDWIDRWLLGPDGIAGTGDELIYNGIDPATDRIRLEDFTDLGIYMYDIYNQRWPVGVGDMPGDMLTYDPDSMTEKAYFGDNQPWDNKAWMFRLAIRYLTDIDYIQTDILGGYGNMFATQLAPLQEYWLDMGNLTASSFVTPEGGITIPSLIYPTTQDIGMAEDLLDAAGFVVGADGVTRVDPRKGGAPTDYLDPLIFYIRLDDSMLRMAGEKLANDLESIGIPVDKRIADKTVCFTSVIVEYEYHLYTGGYSIEFDPLHLYGIWHSSQYWGPTIGWSGGYQGFCNREYDPAAFDVMFGSDRPTVLNGVKEATYVHNKYMPTIPLWSYAGVHAYATGWEGLVNREGYGVDNRWSFLKMHKTGENTIKRGIATNAEAIHVICSPQVPDRKILNQIYDPILARNPYNPAKKTGMIGLHEPGPDGKLETLDDIRGWTTGMWDGGTKIYANISIREDAYFHDGTQVTPEDCKFSIDFLQACGPGVGWGYSGVIDVDHVDTYDNRATGGDWGIVVYFTSGTYWAENFAGFQYVINKKVWVAAGIHEGWGYDPVANTFTPIENRFMVREYHPWEHDYYDAATGTAGSDGIIDIRQDGSGPWIYLGADPLLQEYYDLEANRDWHLTQTFISDYLSQAFHFVGDVNRDLVVKMDDQLLVGRAMWTTPASGGTPGDWWAWNPDADLNLDNIVNIYDAYIVSSGWGRGYVYSKFEALPDATRVVVIPPVTSVGVGEQFTVNIEIENVEGLNAYEFTLSWNPRLLSKISITSGGFLHDDGSLSYMAGSITGRFYEYYQEFLLWEDPSETPIQSGSGTLAEITFQCVGSGVTTLDLSSRLLDLNGYPIPHQDEDGYFYTSTPYVDFTWDPVDPEKNEVVTFDASACWDPDGGTIDLYEWDFGDGTPIVTTTSPITTHAFTAYRFEAYKVTLTVTDNEMDSSSRTKPLRLYHDLAVSDLWNDASVWLDKVTYVQRRDFDLTLVLVTCVNTGTFTESFDVTLTVTHDETGKEGFILPLWENPVTLAAGTGSGFGVMALWLGPVKGFDLPAGYYTMTATATPHAGEVEMGDTADNTKSIGIRLIQGDLINAKVAKKRFSVTKHGEYLNFYGKIKNQHNVDEMPLAYINARVVFEIETPYGETIVLETDTVELTNGQESEWLMASLGPLASMDAGAYYALSYAEYEVWDETQHGLTFGEMEYYGVFCMSGKQKTFSFTIEP